MRKIWTKTPGAVGAADPMTIHASGCFKDPPPCRLFVILIRWLLLLVYPSLEVSRAIDVHAQEHLRVLGSAVLRALPEKQAGLVGIQPSLVRVIRNQIRLSGKLRHPEAVIGVSGKQFQECGCGMSGIAHGDMEFVRGDDSKRRIAKFPPKLVPDCG